MNWAVIVCILVGSLAGVVVRPWRFWRPRTFLPAMQERDAQMVGVAGGVDLSEMWLPDQPLESATGRWPPHCVRPQPRDLAP
jgi:hypothetical protein